MLLWVAAHAVTVKLNMRLLYHAKMGLTLFCDCNRWSSFQPSGAASAGLLLRAAHFSWIAYLHHAVCKAVCEALRQLFACDRVTS